VLAYAVRRLFASVVLLFVGTALVFYLTSISSNPELLLATCPPTRCGPQFVAEFRQLFELDKSIPERYVGWLGDFVQGDLGISVKDGRRPVGEILAERLPRTVLLAVPAFVLTAILAVALGIYSAVRQYSLADNLLTGFSFIGISMPTFFFGLFLQAFWGVWWPKWTGQKPFYVSGYHSGSIGELIASMTLPVMTLMLVSVAGESRFGRASMLDVVNSEYIRTARAKGVPERRVIFKHALRNALIPLVTIWAIDFAGFLAGAVITETVFSWPGIGSYFFEAIQGYDLDVVMAIMIFTAAVTVIFNLIADLLYGVLDPRVRYD
jgi:peptide/nickel transport system permease protein